MSRGHACTNRRMYVCTPPCAPFSPCKWGHPSGMQSQWQCIATPFPNLHAGVPWAPPFCPLSLLLPSCTPPVPQPTGTAPSASPAGPVHPPPPPTLVYGTTHTHCPMCAHTLPGPAHCLRAHAHHPGPMHPTHTRNVSRVGLGGSGQGHMCVRRVTHAQGGRVCICKREGHMHASGEVRICKGKVHTHARGRVPVPSSPGGCDGTPPCLHEGQRGCEWGTAAHLCHPPLYRLRKKVHSLFISQ